MKKFLKVFSIVIGGAVFLAALAMLLPPLIYGENAVMLAVEQLEKPYVLGAAGPVNFDCSGLALYCYAPAGIELFHGAKEVAYDDRYLTIPGAWALLPGDLVFFDTVNDKDLCDHVGLWIGQNKFIHASSSQKKVIISDFNENWQNCYSWAKRVTCPLVYERFFSAASSMAMDFAQKYCSINSP